MLGSAMVARVLFLAATGPAALALAPKWAPTYDMALSTTVSECLTPRPHPRAATPDLRPLACILPQCRATTRS